MSCIGRGATLIALSALGTLASAAGLPGREGIVVTPEDAELVGEADAASQGTVDADQLAHRPLLRPAELLEAVPGVIVTQHSGTGKANQYFLRGFNLDHGTDFAVHVDGMPVNLPSHGHGQGYADLNFLIPELVERIHYRKGPYYADQGDFSSAGAAHVQLRDDFGRGFAELTAGTFGYRRALLGGTQAAGDGARLLGAVELARDDGPWDRPEDLRKVNALLRYARGTDLQGLTITGMAYSNRWSSTDQIPVRAVTGGQLGRFGGVDDTDGGRSERYSLSTRWTASDALSSTRANAYVVRSDLRLFSNFTYFLDDPVNGDQFEQVDRRTVLGGGAAHSWRSTLGGRQVEHTAGVQLRHDDVGEVGLHHTVAQRRLGTIRDDSVAQSSAGLFYLNTVTWAPWLRSTAGLRADALRFKVDSDTPVNSGSGSDRVLSPKLGLVVGPWSNVEYFANYGYGFHSNDVRGATITVDPASGAAAERVTPLVRSKGGELGLRAAPFQGVNTSLALWRLDVDSELLFVGDAGTTEPSRPSRREGLEWGTYMKASRHVTADFDITWSKAHFRDDDPVGSHIPGSTSRTLSGGLTYAAGPWSGGLRLRYFGPRPLVEDDSVRSSSSMLVNARLGYAVSRRLRVGVEVLNLFDREVDDITYFYASQLRGEAGPVSDRHFHPAEPRTLRVSLRLDL
jgi:hypothetical protein